MSTMTVGKENSTSIDLYYEGEDPTPDAGTAFRVYNPEAGCTGTAFRFFGSAGCRGQAIYSERHRVYWIWQLDCEEA